MYVYVFKGSDRLLCFAGDRTGENLPAEQGPWILTTRLEMLQEDDPRPIVQTLECLEDIEMHGFHITNGHRRITDSLDT